MVVGGQEVATELEEVVDLASPGLRFFETPLCRYGTARR
jgi:hypothetical protein